jgi:tetratricopeptide (TPR) repeat protein
LDYSLQALALANTSGDRRSACRIEMNLGETYRLLGDYSAAQAYAERALTTAQELHDQLHEAGALMNLGALALDQGVLTRSRELAAQALPIARAIENRDGEAFLLNTLGQVQFASGEITAAQETFASALALWQTLEPSPYILQAHAGLGENALRQENFGRARQECNAIFEFLKQYPQRASDPAALAALLTCYRVLRALNDDDASAILTRAYAQLQLRADKISNANLKRSFLENVPTNAAIAREWNTGD